MINANPTSTIDNRQYIRVDRIRIGRACLLELKRSIAKLKKQTKDSVFKAFLQKLGVTQSRHVRVISSLSHQNILKKIQSPKRNFFVVDRQLLRKLSLILRASEIFQLIELISCSSREQGDSKELVLAPYELKNLISGALGKQTLNRNLRSLEDAGLLDMRAIEGYKSRDGHRFRKWAIKLKWFCVLFKTINSSLTVLSYFLVLRFNRTFIEVGIGPTPPPNGRTLKDEDIEKEFERLNYEINGKHLPSLKDQLWYIKTQSKIDRREAIKNIIKKESKQKAILKKALNKHTLCGKTLWEIAGFKFLDKFNEYHQQRTFDRFWIFLNTLPNRPNIRNITGTVVADLKGRKSIFDQFLKKADSDYDFSKQSKRDQRLKTENQFKKHDLDDETRKELQRKKDEEAYEREFEGMNKDEILKAIIEKLEKQQGK